LKALGQCHEHLADKHAAAVCRVIASLLRRRQPTGELVANASSAECERNKAASDFLSCWLAILANDYFSPRISMEVMVWRAILLGSSPHYCAAFAPIIENCAQRVKPAATAEVIPSIAHCKTLCAAPRLLSSFPQHSQTH